MSEKAKSSQADEQSSEAAKKDQKKETKGGFFENLLGKKSETKAPEEKVEQTTETPMQWKPVSRTKQTGTGSFSGSVLLQFSLFLAFISFVVSYAVFDSENLFLHFAGISNVGEQLEKARADEEEHYKRLNEINRDIARIEKNAEMNAVKETIIKIKDERIKWTDVLDELKTVTASVPQDFIDDIEFAGYSGDARKKQVGIDVGLKNERLFTLNANFVDAIAEHPEFYDVEFRNYSKDKVEDKLDPGNPDYETEVSIKFKYRPTRTLTE